MSGSPVGSLSPRPLYDAATQSQQQAASNQQSNRPTQAGDGAAAGLFYFNSRFSPEQNRRFNAAFVRGVRQGFDDQVHSDSELPRSRDLPPPPPRPIQSRELASAPRNAPAQLTPSELKAARMADKHLSAELNFKKAENPVNRAKLKVEMCEAELAVAEADLDQAKAAFETYFATRYDDDAGFKSYERDMKLCQTFLIDSLSEDVDGRAPEELEFFLKMFQALNTITNKDGSTTTPARFSNSDITRIATYLNKLAENLNLAGSLKVQLLERYFTASGSVFRAVFSKEAFAGNLKGELMTLCGLKKGSQEAKQLKQLLDSFQRSSGNEWQALVAFLDTNKVSVGDLYITLVTASQQTIKDNEYYSNERNTYEAFLEEYQGVAARYKASQLVYSQEMTHFNHDFLPKAFLNEPDIAENDQAFKNARREVLASRVELHRQAAEDFLVRITQNHASAVFPGILAGKKLDGEKLEETLNKVSALLDGRELRELNRIKDAYLDAVTVLRELDPPPFDVEAGKAELASLRALAAATHEQFQRDIQGRGEAEAVALQGKIMSEMGRLKGQVLALEQKIQAAIEAEQSAAKGNTPAYAFSRPEGLEQSRPTTNAPAYATSRPEGLGFHLSSTRDGGELSSDDDVSNDGAEPSFVPFFAQTRNSGAASNAPAYAQSRPERAEQPRRVHFEDPAAAYATSRPSYAQLRPTAPASAQQPTVVAQPMMVPAPYAPQPYGAVGYQGMLYPMQGQQTQQQPNFGYRPF